MLLEALFLGAMNAICGVGRAVENEKSKRDTASLTPEGNVMSIGRTGQIYVNGEETYRWSETDKYGNIHDLTIGAKSGRVYSDSYDRMVQREYRIAEKYKQDAIKRGKLTYKKFCPQLGIPAETEISTGKVITHFGKFHNERTDETTYRKWYLQPSQRGRFEYNCTIDGDWGVEITKEEYDKLHMYDSDLEGLPDDEDIHLKLCGFDSLEDRRKFYEEKGKKQREEQLKRLQWW